MKPTEDLFDLICSLNKTEKRYFKQHSKLHVIGEKNNYLLLFDAISKQKEYDEAALLKQFQGVNFTKQFAAAKYFLYQQILKVLRSYHRSIHSDVKDIVRNAEILYDKGLYRQSHKVIKKAKKIAQKNEMHWAMLEIFHIWENNLAMKKKDVGWIKNILAEKDKELRLLQTTDIYRTLNTKIYLMYLALGRTRHNTGISRMEKIMNNPMMRSESNAITFDNKYLFYISHLLYWDAKNNESNAFLYTKKGIDLFHSNPEKIDINSSKYIIQISNLILSCLHSKRYEAASTYLDQMKQSAHHIKTHSAKADFFYHYNSLMLSYLCDAAQFSNVLTIISSVEKELKKYENQLGELRKSVLFVNIALAFFGAQQYHKSLLWLNRTRNEISLTARKDIENFIRLFFVIVHYEAGNTDLLPSLIQSLYHFLRKNEQLYKFEIIVIDFFRNELPKTNTRKELIQAFRKLKNQLIPLTKDPYERNVFAFFDYISWLESKIENISFAEVMRRKYKRHVI